MILSIAAFAVVVEVLNHQADRAGVPADGFEILRIVFYAISIGMVLVTSLVHGFMLKSDQTGDAAGISARLWTVNVIVSALAESPAIMGLVLFIGWGYRTDFYILSFVSLYLFVRHFPYYKQWERFARDHMGEKWPSNPVSM